jgi:hypothetical protein
MDGRETDILVLQEDKISYVLSSKNLISDATGGGVIASVPEVLGNQIARSEKYGISFNPESYVHWGYDRFFTDVKRGAVIQLRGNSAGSDQLIVISEMGMRTWFRDTFNESYSTQKLGSFDPYMNEYVLSSNDIQLPINVECLECGISQTFTLSTIGEEQKLVEYCVDLGPNVGIADVVYTVNAISQGASFEISVDYDNETTSTGEVTTSGVLQFNKDKVSVETSNVRINYTGDITLTVIANCCAENNLTIVQVVLTNDYNAGDTIHTNYRFIDGAYTSPLQSNLTIFSSGTNNPLVSRYGVTSGPIGSGAFPPAGSTLSLIASKLSTDTFVFNPSTDKFKYYTSNTLYSNNSTEISNLLSLAITATPNQGTAGNNYAEFVVPALDEYLYLIWDFRASTSVSLCYSDESNVDACCGCEVV